MAEASAWIYLDYAASTPVDPRVADLMAGLLGSSGEHGNPSSTHVPGRRATARIDAAAEQLAALLNTEPARLTWTSGATESDNLAILGAARLAQHRGRHLITMRTEHKAVTDAFGRLQREGFEVTWLDPGSDGRLRLAGLEAAFRADTQLVSVMHVNNETGVIQDIAAIGALCRARGVLFHVDAAQSVGKLPLDLAELPVDLLSMTAHKIYGPKGIGALYVADRPDVAVEALLYGGGQQRGLRPGTLPTHQIAGFGLAAEIAREAMQADLERITRLRDRLWDGIRDLPGIQVNGSTDAVFAGILNVSIEDVEGESLLLALEPLCVATGSACNSTNAEPSYVLRALGRSDALAQSAIRFSFGRQTTRGEIDAAIERYRLAVGRLRALAPERAA
ncbi:MAG: aminotransferase class V-fold PLP-dependent enzyme [Woeseiaceae bacterium]